MAIKDLLPSVWGGRKDVPVTRRETDADPFYSLQRRMNRLFDSFFEEAGMAPFGETFGGYSPCCDVRETDKEVIVDIELPGLDAKDIDISLSDNRLTVSGEKKHESEKKEGGYHSIERSYGSFRRTILLPGEVEPDKVNASYKKGVLTVQMPKSKADLNKTRKIEIKAA